MENKIAVVCNSLNSDLVAYFKCKICMLEESELKNNFLIFKNRKIHIDIKGNKHVYNSSFMSKAFLDKFVFIDMILSFSLFFLIFTNNVKVIHFTTAHISNIFLGTLLRPFNIKQIYTIHDITPHPGKKSFFIKLYNKYVINILADEVIAFSKKEINKQLKKEKFRHFNLAGFPLHISKPKKGDRTILFFGRIENYKGLNNLLNIIRLSNINNLQYKFIIAGKGKIENLEAFQRFENVEIINRFIPDNEILSLFKKASFSILPYDSATQSGVSILSYSYATPVIAYDVGSLSEYIVNGKTGLLCPHKENEYIMSFLRKVTENNIYQMSKNSIRIFKEKYSDAACYKQYLQYYKSLLSQI